MDVLSYDLLQLPGDVFLTVAALVSVLAHAGRFSCSKCSSVEVSAVEYWLLLMLLLACNGIYIWAYMHEDLESWDKPEASQYLEVRTLHCFMSHAGP